MLKKFLSITLIAIFAATAVTALPEEIETEGEPVLGEEDAEVTLVAFEDFQCPFCKRFEEGAFQQIKSNYVDTGEVKVLWKDRPLPQLHPSAEDAAAAMECVYREGGNEAFWDTKNKIFANQNSISTSNVESKIKSWASEEGVSESDVQSCIDNENPMEEVNEDSTEGEDAGASGTPTVFVDDQKIVGAQPYSNFESAIENAEQSGESYKDDSETEVKFEDVETGGEPSLGEKNANLTMMMFGDFEDPFSKRFDANTFSKIKSNYIETGKIRFIWKDKPLSQLHPWAYEAAVTMECVYREGGEGVFWNIRADVFANQDSMGASNAESNIKSWAAEEGISESDLEVCLESEGPVDEVNKDSGIAEELNISGTPTFLIGDQKIVGDQDYSEFESHIEQELNGGETESSDNDSSDSSPDPEDLEERLNDTSDSDEDVNVTALQYRVEEQQSQIEGLKEDQSTILNILENIMNMLGI